MNTTNTGLARVLRRAARVLASTAAAWLLAGCAALQIDVDVYKGPLANDDETQAQQLASMALSAKPLIVIFRNNLLDAAVPGWSRQREFLRADYITWANWTVAQLEPSIHSPPTGDEKAALKIEQLRHARQLNGILSFYADNPCGHAGSDCSQLIGFGKGRSGDGIETLTGRLAAELYDEPQAFSAAKPSSLQKSVALGTRTPAEGASQEARRRASYRQLELLLVDFAARVQFYTNNQWIIAPAQGPGAERLKTLLETVSNTILVQADEMRKKARFDNDQLARGAGELLGARNAFQAPPEIVWDRLLGSYAELKAKTLLVQAPTPSPAPQRGTIPPKYSPEILREIEGVVAARLEKARQAAQLVVVLSTVPATGSLQVALRDLGMLPVAAETTFGKALAESHAKGTVTLETYRVSVSDRISKTMQMTQPDMPAQVRDDLPVMKLLSGAYAALAQTGKLDDAQGMTRANAQTALRQLALARLGGELRGWRESVGMYRDAAGSVVVPVRAPVQRAAAEPRTEAEFASVTAVLTALRPEVLAALNRSPGAVLPDLLAVLRDLVQKQNAGGTARPDIVHALWVVSHLPRPDVQVRIAEKAERPIEVVDSVVASLRHAHLAALSAGAAAEAQNAAAALAQAQKYRADMIHLRPSSAYLRSALPATFAQENASFKWANMLNDTLQNIKRNAAGRDDDELTKTREDLDKVFWQNINRVRLNAGGSTNYVIAKDDVGNWYVKGMGADASAMVRAAKGLALYNMGSRLNTNLLRIDELRGRIDDEPDQNKREEWRAEIEQLGGADSGSGVAFRDGSLDAFRESYNRQTALHLSELKRDLDAGTPVQRLRERWTLTVVQSQDFMALSNTMARPEIAAILDTAKTVLATAPASRSASEAIVEALQAMARYASSLRAAVASDTALLQTPTDSLRVVEQSITLVLPGVSAAFSDLTARADVLSRTTAELSALGADTPIDVSNAKREAVKNAASGYQLAAELYEKRSAEMRLLRAEAEQRRQQLSDARTRRQRAAQDVEAIVGGIVSDWVRRRLRTVEELETAANVMARR